MLMVIDKETKASALAELEQEPRRVAAPSGAPTNQSDVNDEDSDDAGSGRSLAFVYVIVAFVIGLGAIGWAMSAIF
jgi:hypothetical protein